MRSAQNFGACPLYILSAKFGSMTKSPAKAHIESAETPSSEKLTARQILAKLLIEVEHAKDPKGRPSIYTDDFPIYLINYFNMEVPKGWLSTDNHGKQQYLVEPIKMPTIEGFCGEMGMTTTTLNKWVRDDMHPCFTAAYHYVKSEIAKITVQGTMQGNFDRSSSKMALLNFANWREKNEEDLNNKIQITIDKKDGDL